MGFPDEPRLERHRDSVSSLTVDRWRILLCSVPLPAEDQPVIDICTKEQPPLIEHCGQWHTWLGGELVKEVMIFYILYISISFTLFESTTYVSKAHFVCLVACFLLLFEKDVFEKAKKFSDIH